MNSQGLASYDPTQVLNYFTKAVDTTYAGPIPTSLLARQDLEAEVVKLTNRNTPLRDIMPRITGNGSAHLWNQRIALGALPNNNLPAELFYKDGGLPQSQTQITKSLRLRHLICLYEKLF